MDKNKNVIMHNPVSKGMIFLVKSIISQWKVLITITLIFLILIAVLSGLTMAFDLLGNGDNFDLPTEWSNSDHRLTYFEAFWWVFITISTVGYGDIYPITTWMRFWAIIISLIGIMFLALYTAVVVNGFTQEFQRRRDSGEEGGPLGLLVEEVQEEVHSKDEQIKKLKAKNAALRKELKELKEPSSKKK